MYNGFCIVAGLGFGLIYLPAIVSVGYYFEDKRAFATGLAVCGSGLGAFIFNPLSKYLIDEFGWRGAILIEAGLILNCVLCGAMFRPLERPRVASGKGEKATSDELGVHESTHLMKKDSELVKDNIELEIVVDSHGVHQTSPASQPSSPNHISSNLTLMEPPHLKTALFRSDGALHRSSHKPITPSPLTVDSTGQRPPAVRRLLSEDHNPHRAKTPSALGIRQFFFCVFILLLPLVIN